ncbi:hypothetical protein [Risungbinella massiliensis]|uniref:hypothetical protein n=1 Tax=Risungbinella massiliensis TaxID=1329796 RepID=UPI0005CC1947|nr:hypothetical protein [Risungbinella massiliensis]
MDNQYEEALVRSFFSKRSQSRILFELSSPKRRRDALWRLCHMYYENLNEKYMVPIDQPITYPEQILAVLKKNGADDLCYVMSLNTDIDGEYLPLNIALEETVFFGLASIVSCIPDKLAYFQAEQVQGPPPRFILKRNLSIQNDRVRQLF